MVEHRKIRDEISLSLSVRNIVNLCRFILSFNITQYLMIISVSVN